MTAVALGVGQRTAAWLKQQYPDARAKRIARDFGVDERTAKSWLAGNPPSNDHWHLCVARWGKSFITFVYAPYFDWAEQARLDVELETAMANLEEIRTQLRRRNGTHQDMGRNVRSMAHSAAVEENESVATPHRKTDRGAA